MSTGLGEVVFERLTWLEETRCRAAEGAARVSKRLREVENDRKKETVRRLICEEALERIARLPHAHAKEEKIYTCPACIALAVVGGGS